MEVAFREPLASQLAPLSDLGVRVVNPRNGTGEGDADRCSLIVPLCATTVHWDLAWSHCNSSEPPDIVVHPSDREFLRFEDLTTISAYDVHSATSTFNIVSEIVRAFHASETAYAKTYPDTRLTFELGLVAEWPGLQVFLAQEVTPVEVHMALPIDVSSPEAAPDATSDGPTKITLHVVLVTGSTRVPTPSILHKESHLWLEGFVLPGWPEGQSVMEYVIALQDRLATFKAQQQRSKLLRAAYFEALVQLFGSPLEYSADNTKVSFHFVHNNNFVAIVTFQASLDFPERMPDLHVMSLTGSRHGKCVRKTYDQYPYSPRWAAAELASRHQVFLLETMPSFRELCGVPKA